MIKDFQTRENRLKKRDYSADFRLADNDDFFGFNANEKMPFTYWVKVTAIAIAIFPVLYAIVWLFLAITPNI
jgi:hypothetical protein